jgi:hypothetical protein
LRRKKKVLTCSFARETRTSHLDSCCMSLKHTTGEPFIYLFICMFVYSCICIHYLFILFYLFYFIYFILFYFILFYCIILFYFISFIYSFIHSFIHSFNTIFRNVNMCPAFPAIIKNRIIMLHWIH